MRVRKRVLYTGHVQGVGFRYTVQRLAADRPVSGFVRNLPDGRVELVVEGDADETQAFLEAVARHMARHIVNYAVSDEPPEGLADFRIRF